MFAKINGWEDTVAQSQWGVRGYPTLILMSADAEEIDRVPGFLPPDEFVSTMTDYLAGRGTLADLQKRQGEHPDSIGLLLQIAQKYQYRGLDSAAESSYREILGLDPANHSGVADSALHALGMVALGMGAKQPEYYDTAVARFAAVRRQFPTSPLVEDAETYVPYILARQEKYDSALVLYEKFLTDFPQSGEADWVKRQIETVKGKLATP